MCGVKWKTGLSPTPRIQRFRVAGGNPITNQATWRLAGPGKDSYIRLPDWSDGVTSVNAKKKKKKGKTVLHFFAVRRIGSSDFRPLLWERVTNKGMATVRWYMGLISLVDNIIAIGKLILRLVFSGDKDCIVRNKMYKPLKGSCRKTTMGVRFSWLHVLWINKQWEVIALQELIDVTHDNERKPTTETRVTYDNSTWHAMNTTYINSTKETS